MLKKRVIPVLLLRGSRCVKGRGFSDFRDTGNPVMATRVYNAQAADELMFIDIDATNEGRKTMLSVVEKASEEAFMPFTVGGGIRAVEDIRAALSAGADKVTITSAAAERPQLITEAAEIFGSQCVVAGIDVRRDRSDGAFVHYTHSGRVRGGRAVQDLVREFDARGAGEIFINSIDQDGMMQGFDLELVRAVVAVTKKPVIVSGGAGNYGHLDDAFRAGAHAVACASLFHFGDNNPPRVRAYLKNAGYPMKDI